MFKNVIGCVAVCLPLMFCSKDAGAFVSSQTGQVSKLFIRSSDGLIYFFLSGPLSTPAACATGGYWMIKDENSPTGKRQFALLIAARLAGTPVTVTGTGGCTRWNDGEDVDLITI